LKVRYLSRSQKLGIRILTRFVIDVITSMGMTANFEKALAREYTKLIAFTPMVGGSSGVQIPLQRFSGGHIGAALTEVDEGRILHLVLWVDNLDNFNEAGLSGQSRSAAWLSPDYRTH
jgi:hypothetical protein